MKLTGKKLNRMFVKGRRGEREAVNLAWDHGLKADRARKSDGRDLGHAQDVDAVIADLTVQIKRRKRIADYIKGIGSADAQMIREDRGQWWFILPAELMFKILRERGVEVSIGVPGESGSDGRSDSKWTE